MRDRAGFGEAWRDPDGLVWSEAVRSQDRDIMAVGQTQAASLCAQRQARLPTRAEFERVAARLGRETEAGYLPQYLPDLYGNWYWSSTRAPELRGAFYAFGGAGGVIEPRGLDFAISVRCVADS